jgi:phosphoribosylamine---glycine ligase
MRILLIGNGGREHAMAWKIAQSQKLTQLFIAPGNAGTAQVGTNLNINATDIEGLANFAREKKIDLVAVGPEAPLAEGIADKFNEMGIPVFGPSKAAAEIESSKVFSKYLMQKYNIPCGKSESFESFDEAKIYIEKQKPPIVVKADGLAAGKGVVVANSKEEALAAIADFMNKKTLGKAGNRIIIEEFLIGREMSTFAFTDAKTVVPLVPACDYKTVFDAGKGPNTGGMGAYSPPYFFTPELGKKVQDTIMMPTVRALAAEGRPYKGLLYGGLMINGDSVKALEFNARFGDPETQVVMPRLKTDLVEIMLAVINNTLDKITIEWSTDACVAVVLASGSYPGSYKTGFPITGLDKLPKDLIVFHAGTKIDDAGKIVTNGGRVLAVAATGKNVDEARQKVYASLDLVRFEGCHHRSDIALIKGV